jgi:hypothetical protein
MVVLAAISGVAGACGSGGGDDSSSTAPAVDPAIVAPAPTPAAVPPGETPGPTIPGASELVVEAQSAADAAMVWVGEAYRLLAGEGRVSEAGLAQLSAAYAGRALAAETAVYRQYGKDVSALASSPAAPLLEVVAVGERQPGCYVVRARFDENPILAFPVESGGIEVIAVLRRRDGFWKVAVLARSSRELDGRIDCTTT